MKKVLSIAVAALVLSVGGAFAEPPVTAVAGDYPGVDNPGLEQLTDADMVALVGRGWRSEACSAAVLGAGALIFRFGVVTNHVPSIFVGLFSPALAADVCY